MALTPPVLKTVLHQLACSSGVSARLARAQGESRILMFHGITKKQATDFERQLCYLAREFRVCTLHELLDLRLPNAVALTFDDGLRNNVTIAYPLLRQYGVRATFYVCPGLIGNGRWLWNHEARQRLSRISADARLATARLVGSSRSDTDDILDYMKTLSLKARAHAEAAIRAATPDFVPTTAESEAFDLVGWNDLAILDPALITIGCHSMSHSILATLEDGELEHEVTESRRILEQTLRRPVCDFSYPNGSHDRRVVNLVRKTYETGVTTQSRGLKSDSDRCLLPRIPSADTLSLLAWRMHRPRA